jgi:hypothetical protein
VTPSDRSLAAITPDDLSRLAQIAREDRESFFARYSKYSVLADRLIAVALCQGAALHLLDGQTGVKDFDVWTFYAAHPKVTYPARRRATRDFGDPKFGRTPGREDFVGRQVDLLGRSLNTDVGTDPVAALRVYLEQKPTSAARYLAQKAAVIIEPAALLGTVAWPKR